MAEELGFQDAVAISAAGGEVDVDPVRVERIVENPLVNARFRVTLPRAGANAA